MKKRTFSIGGRPGPLSHATQSQFSRLPVSIPGCRITPRPIESARADITPTVDGGSQQESQSKHPFLSRSGQPYSSQSQRSLSQSQNTQEFSQNSQPEDYGCDLWNRPGFHDKEISLSQPKPPSPYFAGLTSSLNRRNVSGTVEGGSTPASTTSTTLRLVGPQNSTPRPWPQCNVSEELEKRLAGLEKVTEDEAALLQKICDDYKQIKIFLEETCFESKDNRSKLALQQNALHTLLKEEETANNRILTAIKTSGDVILQDIRNLKQAADEADIANRNTVTASFERMIQSFREEVLDFKRDLKDELHVMKQSLPVRETLPPLLNIPVAITDTHRQLLNESSRPQMDFTGSTPRRSIDHFSPRPFSTKEVVDLEALLDSDLQNRSDPPIFMPEVVDLDDFSDSDFDTGLASLAEDHATPVCTLVAKNGAKKKKRTRSNRLEEQCNITDENMHSSVSGKNLRAQKRVCYNPRNLWRREYIGKVATR